jgi:hypothetical protein
VAKDHVYRRLHEILGGADHSADYAQLSAADRDAMREILADTKPGFSGS